MPGLGIESESHGKPRTGASWEDIPFFHPGRASRQEGEYQAALAEADKKRLNKLVVAEIGITEQLYETDRRRHTLAMSMTTAGEKTVAGLRESLKLDETDLAIINKRLAVIPHQGDEYIKLIQRKEALESSMRTGREAEAAGVRKQGRWGQELEAAGKPELEKLFSLEREHEERMAGLKGEKFADERKHEEEMNVVRMGYLAKETEWEIAARHRVEFVSGADLYRRFTQAVNMPAREQEHLQNTVTLLDLIHKALKGPLQMKAG
jgi:hypothetical protein